MQCLCVRETRENYSPEIKEDSSQMVILGALMETAMLEERLKHLYDFAQLVNHSKNLYCLSRFEDETSKSKLKKVEFVVMNISEEDYKTHELNRLIMGQKKLGYIADIDALIEKLDKAYKSSRINDFEIAM